MTFDWTVSISTMIGGASFLIATISSMVVGIIRVCSRLDKIEAQLTDARGRLEQMGHDMTELRSVLLRGEGR